MTKPVGFSIPVAKRLAHAAEKSGYSVVRFRALPDGGVEIDVARPENIDNIVDNEWDEVLDQQ